MRKLTLEFLLSDNFERYQNRINNKIKKISKSDDIFQSMVGFSFCAGALLSSILVLFLELGLFEFLIWPTFTFLSIFAFLYPFHKKIACLEKNKNKSEKYNNLAKYNKYKHFYEIIDNSDFQLLSSKKELILDNLHQFNTIHQEEILALISKKIEIYSNTAENIKERIDQLEGKNIQKETYTKVIQSI